MELLQHLHIQERQARGVALYLGLTKGLKKVRAEVSLAAWAYNLKRALAVLGLDQLLAALRQAGKAGEKAGAKAVASGKSNTGKAKIRPVIHPTLWERWRRNRRAPLACGACRRPLRHFVFRTGSERRASLALVA